MSAEVVPWSEANDAYRALCHDDECQTGPHLNKPWRTWIVTKVRAASLAADHNRAKHGGAK